MRGVADEGAAGGLADGVAEAIVGTADDGGELVVDCDAAVPVGLSLPGLHPLTASAAAVPADTAT